MKRSLAPTALAAVLVLAALPAAAYPRPGRTERVTLGVDGAEADGVTYESVLSDDGRFVAFGSQATNLVPGDTNEVEDIFVHDRGTGSTERVSVSAAGEEGNDTSFHAVLTPDGRFVTFTSHATNLVPGDTNGVTDVFVVDRETGAIERVSVSSSGVQTERRAFDPAISADGRYVAFISGSTTLDPPDTNGGCDQAVEGGSQGCDVFVHDRVTGATVRVSEGPNGEQGNGPSGWRVDISADGRYVSFYSFATTFTPGLVGDRNSFSDIFVKDRLSGGIERVSVASDGTEANAGSTDAAISDDGRYVAFTSIAPNLVPTESDPLWNDIFVHDRVTRQTERVSVSSTGREGNGHSYLGDISADGRYVVFTSDATTLVAGDTNGARDAFVHDRLTRTTERITVADDGTEGDGDSVASSITPDGRLAGFGSNSTNLVPGDQNGKNDSFVRTRGPAIGIGALDVATAGQTVQASGWAGLSGAAVSAATDPPNDGEPGAREVGAQITEAGLIHRPESGDLLFRLRLAALPGVRGRSRVPGIGGLPGIGYQLIFTLGSQTYELRAGRRAGTALNPEFRFFNSSGSTVVPGGFGTTGEEIVASIPLSLLELGPDPLLTNVRVYAGVIDTIEGPIRRLDEMNLANASVDPATVALGLAPAGTDEADVPFGTAAALTDGTFSGTLDASGLPAGEYDVWARACLGATCGAASRRLTL